MVLAIETPYFGLLIQEAPAILDVVETKLNLDKKKLEVTRHVLSEYGNMSSACVLFILDEMRNKSLKGEKATTGDVLEWGVLFGFGMGLTIQTDSYKLSDDIGKRNRICPCDV